MAFGNRNASQSNESNDSWKKQGFLNLYLNRKDGSKYKVGAIGLKLADADDKHLIEYLSPTAKDGSIDKEVQVQRLAAFLSKVEVTFNRADSAKPEAGLDL